MLVQIVPGIVTAILGLAWGWELSSIQEYGTRRELIRSPITPVALIGVAMVGLALDRWYRRRRVRLICAAVLAYQVAILLDEPFQFIDSEGYSCARGIVLLTPLFLLMSELTRLRIWWAVLGVSIFTIASIALTIDNGVVYSHMSQGNGFFSSGRTP